MLPRVIIHNAVSVDGRTVGFPANLALFDELAATWHEDVTLAGSETMLAATADSLAEAPSTAEVDRPGGVLAVVDARGRVKDWGQIKTWPFWQRFVSIGAATTPAEHQAYLRYQNVESMTAGDKGVDLSRALTQLAECYEARVVRVESGGWLNGALLEQGLVDEVSLLIHPLLVGGFSPATLFRATQLAHPARLIDLELADCQKLDDAYVWLRYKVRSRD